MYVGVGTRKFGKVVATMMDSDAKNDDTAPADSTVTLEA